MTNSEGFSLDAAIFPQEYFVLQGKWRAQAKKTRCLGMLTVFR